MTRIEEKEKGQVVEEKTEAIIIGVSEEDHITQEEMKSTKDTSPDSDVPYNYVIIREALLKAELDRARAEMMAQRVQFRGS